MNRPAINWRLSGAYFPVIWAFLSATLCLFGAESEKNAPFTTVNVDGAVLRIAVTGVEELRISPYESRFYISSAGDEGGLLVKLAISGEGFPKGSAVRSVYGDQAVDDKGRVLRLWTGGGSSVNWPGDPEVAQSMRRVFLGNPGPLSLKASTHFLKGPRGATSLKHLEGKIEILTPSETDGSMVRIPDIMSHSGLIEHPVLRMQGIRFYFFPDKAAYDQSRSLFSRNTTEPRFPAQVAYHDSGAGGYPRSSNVVQAFQFQDQDGTPIEIRDFSSGGTPRTIDLVSPLPKGAQLVLFLPGAIKSIPFRVENIPLP